MTGGEATRRRTIILRTPEEKATKESCWHRPDSAFFASGACHVLAGAFLGVHPDAGFSCWMVRPVSGDRGRHVVVMSGPLVFDWMGYSESNGFLREYKDAMRALVPSWNATLEPLLLDPLGWDFCKSERHRHPSQFLHDPIPRAVAYVHRFPQPAEVAGCP